MVTALEAAIVPRLTRTRLVRSGCAGLIMTIACVHPRAETIAAIDGDKVTGAGLYLEHCQECHGSDARSGTAGIDLTAEFHHSEEIILSMILNGPGDMPAFEDVLDDQQAADLYAYLVTFDK